MTVGNGEGNFFADDETLDRLEGEGQVVFRYKTNPNGSARGIAGIVCLAFGCESVTARGFV